MRRTVATAALLLPLGALAAATARAAERPPSLDVGPGCDRWVGTATGNDPSVTLEIVLCPEGGNVVGEAQWSSLESGWNRRAVEGRFGPDRATLELHDTRFLAQRPAGGWRFCLIDRYALAQSAPDTLRGTYVSEACLDRATVHLTRAAMAPPPDATVPPRPAGLLPDALPARPGSEASRGRIVCGCRVGERPSGAPWPPAALAAAALLASGRRRRLRRGPRRG